MAIRVVVHIMEQMDLPRPWAAVLMAMGDHADDDGRHCFPSVDRIAWKANYKPRQVASILRDMEKAGIITKVADASQHRAAEYQINLNSAPKKIPFDEWRKAHGRHAARDAKNASLDEDQGCNLASPGVQSHSSGVQSHAPGMQPIASEPINRQLEPSVNRQSARAKRRGKLVPYPDDFKVTEDMYEWALKKKGLLAAAVDYESERFENWSLAKDAKYVDWKRAWQNWMAKAANDQKQGRGPQYRAGSGNAGSRAEDPERRNWTAEQWFED